ncbi:apolipoprotein C-I [Chaetodon trifascialis]|uniref:apolipoprotein C-I n=1 Tax=Chaetodon trifascialis TaxID=109706 RepID=UPI003993B2C5
MRLLLAVAVLVLAFVAYTEAQEDTVEGRITKFGHQVTEMGSNLLERGKEVLERARNSEVATASKQFFQSGWEKLRETWADLTQ